MTGTCIPHLHVAAQHVRNNNKQRSTLAACVADRTQFEIASSGTWWNRLPRTIHLQQALQERHNMRHTCGTKSMIFVNIRWAVNGRVTNDQNNTRKCCEVVACTRTAPERWWLANQTAAHSWFDTCATIPSTRNALHLEQSTKVIPTSRNKKFRNMGSTCSKCTLCLRTAQVPIQLSQTLCPRKP